MYHFVKVFFFFFKKDKKPQEPSSSVRQIVLSVLQRLKVGGLHMILQCYKEMSDDTTGKTILQVATWSLKHPLLEGFTFMLCLVFLCIFFFLRNFVLSLLLYCYFTKNIFIGGTELLFVLWCSFYNLKEWRRRKKTNKKTKNPTHDC